MGCITSKTNFINDNPNRFDVIYADTENECRYWRSQLEITGNSLVDIVQIYLISSLVFAMTILIF